MFAVYSCRTDGGNKGGTRRPPQRILKQPCELAVSVRNVRGIVFRKRGNDIAQCTQTRINGLGLAQPRTLAHRPPHAL